MFYWLFQFAQWLLILYIIPVECLAQPQYVCQAGVSRPVGTWGQHTLWLTLSGTDPGYPPDPGLPCWSNRYLQSLVLPGICRSRNIRAATNRGASGSGSSILDLGLMYASLSSDVHSPPILAAWVSTGESSLGRLTGKDNQTCWGRHNNYTYK